jgi:hypothetical protein
MTSISDNVSLLPFDLQEVISYKLRLTNVPIMKMKVIPYTILQQ